MARLYNFEAREYVNVPDEQVSALVQAGTHGFPQNQEVNILLPNGQGYTIPSDDAAYAFKLGAQYESPEATDKRVFKEEYGSGFGNALLAFGAGLGRGVTLGMSDAVLSAAVDPRIMQTYREEFGGLSTTGQIVGGLGPALLTGGAGAVGTAARLTPSGILALNATRAGQVASERALRKLAVDGLARKATQATSMVLVAGGAESLGAQAGTELTDMVLLDKPKSANEIIANLGFSALLGGALGGVLGGGAVLGVAGAKRTAEASKRLFENALDMPMVQGGVDVIAKALTSITGEPLERTRLMLDPSRKAVAGKKQVFNDEAVNKALLDEVKLERHALRAQKLRNKIADQARRFDLEVDAETARMSMDIDAEAAVQRRQSITNQLSDEEIEIAISDLEIHGKLDDLVKDKAKVQELGFEAKRNFLRDNLDLLEAHTAQKVEEIEELAKLNQRAAEIRENTYGISQRGRDNVNDFRYLLNENKRRSREVTAQIKDERRDMINSYTDEEITLGLEQLRDQGMLVDRLFNLKSMTAKQKRAFAIEKADYMFLQAQDDAERALLFDRLQDDLIEDRLVKENLADRIETTRKAVREAKVAEKSEAQRLIEDANSEFDRLADEAAVAVDKLYDDAEAITQKMQRVGAEDGEGRAKEGFYKRVKALIPKPTPEQSGEVQGLLDRVLTDADDYLQDLEKALFEPEEFIGDVRRAAQIRLDQTADTRLSRLTETYEEFRAEIISLRNLAEQQDDAQILMGESFEALDRLKRRIQETQRFSESMSPAARRQASKEGELIQAIETAMGNRELFGDAAITAYNKVNAAISGYLSARRTFERSLMKQGSFETTRKARGLSDKDLEELPDLEAMPTFSVRKQAKTGALGNILRQIDKNGAATTEARRELTNFIEAADRLNRTFKSELKDAGAENIFGPRHQALSESITNARGLFERARKSKNTINAYQMVTGRRIPFDELTDEARLAATKVEVQAKAVDNLQATLEDLVRQRRGLGAESFALSKDLASDARRAAAEARKHLSKQQSRQILALADKLDAQSEIQKRISALKAEAAEKKLNLKNARTQREKQFNRRLGKERQLLRQTEDALAKMELDVRKGVQRALDEQRELLAKQQAAVGKAKTARQTADQYRKFKTAQLKQKADDDLLDVQRELNAIQQQRETLKTKIAGQKKLYKADKAEKVQSLKVEEAKLAEAERQLKEEIKRRQYEIKARKYADDDALDKAELELLMKESAARQALDSLGSGMDGVGASVLAGAAGAIPFGATGALLGATVAAMTRPATFGRGTVLLWDIANATEEAIKRGADNIVNSLFAKTRPQVKPRAARLPTFLGFLSGLADTDVDSIDDEEFDKASRRLTHLAQNQQLQTKILEDSTKDLAETPELRAEVQRQASNIIQVVNRYNPKQPGTTTPLLRRRPYQPPRSEKAKLASVIDVVEDFVGTMVEGVIDNTLTQDQVDVSRLCFPEAHASLAAKVAEQIAEVEFIPEAKIGVLRKLVGSSIDLKSSGSFLSVTQGAHAVPQNEVARGGNFNQLKNQSNRAILPLQGPLQSGAGPAFLT